MAYDALGTTQWRDAIRSAEGVAAALLGGRRSLEGERVALLVTPGATFITCLFGVLRAGGTAVVLSPLHPTPETAYVCDAPPAPPPAAPTRPPHHAVRLNRRPRVAHALV